MNRQLSTRHAMTLCVLILCSIPIAGCQPHNTVTPLPSPTFIVLTPSVEARIDPTLTVTPTAQATPLPLDLSAIEAADWDIYDPDPDHLWNRILRHFYSRSAPRGEEYGQDTLDPLLWPTTIYLLEGES